MWIAPFSAQTVTVFAIYAVARPKARQPVGMGYNTRNDEIRGNITRMLREWEAQRGALATGLLHVTTVTADCFQMSKAD